MVEIRKDGIYLDGERFFLISGEFHYFRTLPGGWRRRLELMKDFGLTAVTTYVPWNLHQPTPDAFCFDGHLDVERFLNLAAEVGLKVFLRPSPYMCGEFEFGGLPSWLLRDHNVCLRSCDPSFMKPLERYYSVLLPKLVPYLHANGGPIILVGLENEYGSYGSDKEYLRLTEQMYRRYGIDLPLTTCGGTDAFKMLNGYLEGTWYGADLFASASSVAPNFDALAEFQPDKPLMCSEAWVGHMQFWGNGFSDNREAEKHALFTKQVLEKGGSISYYMFCGGTNFGFTSGALVRKQTYEALCTSYDYDAPISEEGLLKDKYFAMRDVLDEFLGKPKRPHLQPDYRAQALGEVVLTETAPLLPQSAGIADGVYRRMRPVCMEELGQDYGFIRYTTHINYTDSRVRHLHVDGVADRATVYVDGRYIGTILRDQPEPDITFTVPEQGCDLTVLVENMGRISYGYRMYDRKGILGCVRYDIENADGTFLYNFAVEMDFTIETLPMKDLSSLQYGQQTPMPNTPCFYRGTFKAQAGVDTFVDMAGWHKGNVFINGFNLGRYWEVGPQRTLYLPGELIKEENVIEVFELYGGNRTAVTFIDHPLLCEIPKDPNEIDFQLQ